MQKLILILIILVTLLVSLVACGKPEEEQEPLVNQEAVVNCAETIAAHQYLLKKHEELKGICQSLQENQAEYIAAINTLNAEKEALRIALALNQSLSEGRQVELGSALNELVKLREEKLEWGRFAEKASEQLLKNYNRLDALFPPTHFTNDKELIKWRANTGNVTELGCLGLQKLALADGYIVSAHPDLEYCLAIAGNYWYRIIPGDQDLVEKIGKIE